MRAIMYGAKVSGAHCSILDSGRTFARVELHEQDNEQASIDLHFDTAEDVMDLAEKLQSLAVEIRAIEKGEAA